MSVHEMMNCWGHLHYVTIMRLKASEEDQGIAGSLMAH